MCLLFLILLKILFLSTRKNSCRKVCAAAKHNTHKTDRLSNLKLVCS